MTRFKFGLRTVMYAALAGLLMLSGAAWQSALAQGAPRPAQLPPAQPAALSSSLSYYFISGATFMAGTRSNGTKCPRTFSNSQQI